MFEKAARIVLLTKVIRLIITMSTMAIFGRYLLPEEIGLYAIFLIPIQFMQPYLESGFTNVHYKYRDENIARMLNTTTFFISILLSLIFFIVGTLMIKFKYESIDTLVLVLFVIYIMFSGSIILPKAELLKNERFRVNSLLEMFAVVVSSLIGIGFALMGYGLYSLIVKLLFDVVLFRLGLFVIGVDIGYAYRIENTTKYHEALFYGFRIAISRSLSGIGNIYDKFIIALLYPTNLVGIFHYTKNLAVMPDQVLRTAITSPSFVYLSMADTLKEKANIQIRMEILLAILVYPVIGILYFQTEFVIYLLLGEEWLNYANYLSYLSLFGLGLIIKGILNTILIDAKKVKYLNRLLLLGILLSMGVGTIVYVANYDLTYFIQANSYIIFTFWTLIYIKDSFFKNNYSNKMLSIQALSVLFLISALMQNLFLIVDTNFFLENCIYILTTLGLYYIIIYGLFKWQSIDLLVFIKNSFKKG